MKDRDTAIVYDLDGVLCDTRGRAHLLPREGDPPERWVTYSMACLSDTLMPGMGQRMALDWAAHRVIIVSGRLEEAAALTRAWLRRNAGRNWDGLVLLPGGPPRTAAEVTDFRAGCINGIRESMEVVLSYDSTPAMAQAVRRRCGVPSVLAGAWPAAPAPGRPAAASRSAVTIPDAAARRVFPAPLVPPGGGPSRPMRGRGG
jgi:hypothetical protein